MKRRRCIATIAVILLLGGLAVSVLRPKEPSYGGRTLSQWLEIYDPSRSQDLPLAKAAVEQMGTNAIPSLLRLIRKKDSAIYVKALTFLQGHGYFTDVDTHASELNYRAEQAFQTLGAQARAAVPELIAIYNQRVSITSQDAVVLAMAAMGSDAESCVPLLLQATAHSDPNIRQHSFFALWKIHAHPELVVPVLVKAAADPDPVTSTVALNCLGGFGTNSVQGLPIVREAFNSTDEKRSRVAAYALKLISPEVAEEAGVYKKFPEFRPATTNEVLTDGATVSDTNGTNGREKSKRHKL